MDARRFRHALTVVGAAIETLCASVAGALLAIALCRYVFGVSDAKVLGAVGLLIFLVVWRVMLQLHPRFE